MGDFFLSSDILNFFLLQRLENVSYLSFICMISILSRYFISFLTTMKGFISMILFPVYFPFVYWLTEIFLYTVTLLKVFTCYWRYLLKVLGSILYIAISSANYNTLTSFFPRFIPLTSFSCLISLVKPSSTILSFSSWSIQHQSATPFNNFQYLYTSYITLERERKIFLPKNLFSSF